MKKQIEEAIKNYQNALIETIEASREETKAKDRKMKARYQLHQAREALSFLESDLKDELSTT